MSVPLSVMRGQRAPGKKWRPLDRLLVLALQAHEDDLCPGCGQPRTYSMDRDAARRYAVREVTCNGCAELDRVDAGNQQRKPGVRRYVTPDAVLTHAMHYPIHVPSAPHMTPASPLVELIPHRGG